MPDFPIVPNVPGVPALFRLPGLLPPQISLLVADASNLGSLLGLSPGPQWGLFDTDLNPVVIADSVNALQFDNDWRIATFMIEGGDFESYDKVANPYNHRIRFVTGGALSKRQDMLDSITNIAGDLNHYNVVTPQRTYVGVNVLRYSYSQTNVDGVGLMKVDVEVQEIRIGNSATVTPAATQPSGVGQVNAGTQQPQPATTQQNESVLHGLFGDVL